VKDGKKDGLGQNYPVPRLYEDWDYLGYLLDDERTQISNISNTPTRTQISNISNISSAQISILHAPVVGPLFKVMKFSWLCSIEIQLDELSRIFAVHFKYLE